jgi:hypothetical protein
MVMPTPADTAAARRLVSSSDAGPGILVTMWRLCSMADTPKSLSGDDASREAR